MTHHQFVVLDPTQHHLTQIKEMAPEKNLQGRGSRKQTKISKA